MKWLDNDSASDFSVRGGLKNLKGTYGITMAESCINPLTGERGE